jgi:hypothetical protein
VGKAGGGEEVKRGDEPVSPSSTFLAQRYYLRTFFCYVDISWLRWVFLVGERGSSPSHPFFFSFSSRADGQQHSAVCVTVSRNAKCVQQLKKKPEKQEKSVVKAAQLAVLNCGVSP